MKYTCCVCDMDGTLLDSMNRISDENIKALKLLADKGVTLVLATGRIDIMIKKYIRDIGIEAPIISCNGGLIRDVRTNRIYYKKLMDRNITGEIIDFCDERDINYLVYTENMVYYNSKNKRADIYKSRNENTPDELKTPIMDIRDADKKDISAHIIKILICDVVSDDKASLMEELNRHFNSDERLTIVSSAWDLIDIMAADTTKGNGLKYLSGLLNIDLEKTVVFGDNYNDISMFKVAGLPIAMANAEEEVKRIASRVTRSNDESGVGYGIHKYVLENPA